MKKSSRAIMIFSIMLVVLTTLYSCAGRLKADFICISEINGNHWIEFYGINRFGSYEIYYDTIINMDHVNKSPLWICIQKAFVE